jgi:hypothetical protein
MPSRSPEHSRQSTSEWEARDPPNERDTLDDLVWEAVETLRASSSWEDFIDYTHALRYGVFPRWTEYRLARYLPALSGGWQHFGPATGNPSNEASHRLASTCYTTLNMPLPPRHYQYH